ncbi:MAG: cell envelope integrity protein CreD, partial [Pseudomonadota bacterium]
MKNALLMRVASIAGVAALIFIPIAAIKHKIEERESRRDEASREVVKAWSGPQVMTTPILVIPYRYVSEPSSGFHYDSLTAEETYLVVMPEVVRSDIEVDASAVYRGIFEIPVFTAQTDISGYFSADKVQKSAADLKVSGRSIVFGVPYIGIYIKSVRGVSTAPSILINAEPVPLKSGSGLLPISSGLRAELMPIQDINENLEFSMTLTLRGMGRYSMINLADSSTATFNSNWPHPQFYGFSLPAERSVSSDGFSATWHDTQFTNDAMRLLQNCLQQDHCPGLMAAASGVAFINPVDVYLQSERSVKYAFLFIGLIFTAFLIFEQRDGRRIHPIQYGFVGLVIAIFYLLLLSLAEHTAFHLAYLCAVVGCASLLWFYLRYVLGTVLSATVFVVMLSALYAALYFIIGSEDFALMLG